ncbi:MAG: NAD(P)H-hydrate epimerase, partial [Candidatus Nanopelagicales bacterium]
MMRAATGLARRCAALLGDSTSGVYGSRVVLLVGPGNNGGDALFAGALLARRGAHVVAVVASDKVHDAGRRALAAAHGRFVDTVDAEMASLVECADLIVDGLVGIGGRAGLTGVFAELAVLATEGDALVVSVDVPSGIDPDTGAVAGEAIWADVTVTFGAIKPGLVLGPGSDHVGLLDVVDIRLAPEPATPTIAMLEAEDAARMQPHPLPTDHKYSQGVVGVLAGSVQYPGAAVLCVGGAINTKAGLVRYVGQSAYAVVSAWPSAIVSTSRPREIGRVQAWVAGPGLGLDEDALLSIGDVLADRLPVVIDADALTLVADDPSLVTGRDAWTVVTPHDGEFARLAPDL